MKKGKTLEQNLEDIDKLYEKLEKERFLPGYANNKS